MENDIFKNVKNLSGISQYVVSGSDDIINVDTSISAITIYLPNIKSSGTNKRYYINDIGNNASVHNITVVAIGNLVNSGSSVILNVNGISAECVITSQTEWLLNLSGDTGGGAGAFVKQDGSTPLTGAWSVGAFKLFNSFLWAINSDGSFKTQSIDCNGQIDMNANDINGVGEINSGTYTLYASGTAKFASGQIYLNNDGSANFASGKFTIDVDGNIKIGANQYNIFDNTNGLQMDNELWLAGGLSMVGTAISDVLSIAQTANTWALNSDGSANFASGNLMVYSDGTLISQHQVRANSIDIEGVVTDSTVNGLYLDGSLKLHIVNSSGFGINLDTDTAIHGNLDMDSYAIFNCQSIGQASWAFNADGSGYFANGNATFDTNGAGSWHAGAGSLSFGSDADFSLNSDAGNVNITSWSDINLGTNNNGVVRVANNAFYITTTGVLIDSLTDNASISIQQNILFDSIDGGVPTLNWANKQLITQNTSTPSLDWENHTLIDDNNSNVSINWANYLAFDDQGQGSINWLNRNLVDSNDVNSFNWQTRHILANDGAISIDAGSGGGGGRILYDSSGLSSLKWDNRTLIGNWSTDTGAGFTFGGDVTLANTINLILNTTTGSKIGTATSQKLGFWNKTPIVQPSGASQASVVTTASTNVTPFGFTTSAQADSIVTLVNAIRLALVNAGLIKGSA